MISYSDLFCHLVNNSCQTTSTAFSTSFGNIIRVGFYTKWRNWLVLYNNLSAIISLFCSYALFSKRPAAEERNLRIYANREYQDQTAHLRVNYSGGGGGGCEWGGARGVITWGWLWYGCTTQNFETYPIHTPGIWKNWPIHILDRPKCWPSHILPFDFISHLLLVVARYRSQFIEYQVNKQPQKIYERKKYTHILGCQKSGAFHIRIKKNGVSHILFVEKKWG